MSKFSALLLHFSSACQYDLHICGSPTEPSKSELIVSHVRKIFGRLQLPLTTCEHQKRNWPTVLNSIISSSIVKYIFKLHT
jgi:hypothetical protein